MPSTPFQFDQEKAAETIIYLAKKLQNADVLGICKLLYFADKTSLERYGRFIFGDEYVAMKAGPVPSHVYDLLKSARETDEYGFKVEGNKVVPLRRAKVDLLSESDLTCLNQIIELYGNAPNWKRIDDSHDDAWEAAWESREDRDSVPINLENIIDMFEDPEDLKDYVFNRDA